MKLRAVKFLGNPKARKKKKAARKKPLQRSRKRLRAAAQKNLVRAIVATPSGYRHLYWGGSKWTTGRNFAKRYSGAPAAPELAKMKAKLPAGWVSVDALPA